MKLLYLVPNCNKAEGLARVLSIKTNFLVEKWDYKVHILTQNNGNRTPFYPFHSAIVFHDMILKGSGIFFIKNYIQNLKKQITTINPDIVIVCDNGLKAYTIPFFIQTDIPLIFECHSSKYIQENKPKSSFLTPIQNLFIHKYKNFGASKYDLFVALSKESLAEWKVSNSTIIPNPIWIEPTGKSPLDSKKVIAVSRNSYEKGLDRLLRIWQKIYEIHPDWTLEIYGSNMELLQPLLNELSIKSSVSFYQPVLNIQEKYQEASLFVVTSRFEGFSMVLVEAMSLGLPCIAYDCPIGPRSIIQNLENGVLVEDGNELEFVKQLSQLIEDKDYRNELREKAIQSVFKYKLEPVMLQWKGVFENFI